MDFDAKSGAFGCASFLAVVAFIGLGLMLLAREAKGREIWALYLIACGVAGLVGFVVFGRKKSADAARKDDD